MKKVTLTFIGHKSNDVAKNFYHWIVDGGLEDSIIDTLSNEKVDVNGISDFNNDTLDIAITSNAKST